MLKNDAWTSSNIANDLGNALRVRRKELQLSMQSVADGAGLSVGFISQVERGLTAPSLSSLVSITKVLEMPLSAVLDQPGSSGGMTQRGKREAYSVPGDVHRYERLSATFEGAKLHSVIVHEPPGHQAEPISHDGEEMFYLLEGSLTIEIEGETHILHKGDSLHFDSTRKHASWNHTTEPSTFLWCGTLDIFGDRDQPNHTTNKTTRTQI